MYIYIFQGGGLAWNPHEQFSWMVLYWYLTSVLFHIISIIGDCPDFVKA
jgi:hypothetical protein